MEREEYQESPGLEETVQDITKLLGGDEPPVEESKSPEETITEDPSDENMDDELDSIVDELNEETEVGDQEKSDEDAEESDEELDDGDKALHTVMIDGEEHEVSLHDLKRHYGREQALTKKEMAVAEQRKSLDAEAQAVAWVKAQPEARKLVEQINEAEEAISRGFVFDENGNQVRLTQAQVEQTKQNVANARDKVTELAKPPRLDELYEAIPAFKDPASAEAQEILKPFGDTLSAFGYSQPEITALNDPRTFLMLKELHELRELQSQVNTAKARRAAKKPTTANRVTKSAKPAGTKSTSAPTQSKSTKETIEQINLGEASPADLFMED